MLRRIPLFKLSGLVLVVLLAAGLILPGGLELRVTLLKTGQPLLILPLKPAERFTLHYYHSVENAPIWEAHSLDKEGRIYIEEERYEKFGAGMGRMPGVGRLVHRGRYEVIEDMHMPVDHMILRIGSPGVDHTIIWRGFKTNLSAVAPHEAARFRGRPISLARYYWRRLFPYPATAVIKSSHDN